MDRFQVIAHLPENDYRYRNQMIVLRQETALGKQLPGQKRKQVSARIRVNRKD
jgi:hypothetical protein